MKIFELYFYYYDEINQKLSNSNDGNYNCMNIMLKV